VLHHYHLTSACITNFRRTCIHRTCTQHLNHLILSLMGETSWW